MPTKISLDNPNNAIPGLVEDQILKVQDKQIQKIATPPKDKIVKPHVFRFKDVAPKRTIKPKASIIKKCNRQTPESDN